jgi:hypothetical protein
MGAFWGESISRKLSGWVELRRGASIFLVFLASSTSSSEGMYEMEDAVADMAITSPDYCISEIIEHKRNI